MWGLDLDGALALTSIAAILGVLPLALLMRLLRLPARAIVVLIKALIVAGAGLLVAAVVVGAGRHWPVALLGLALELGLPQVVLGILLVLAGGLTRPLWARWRAHRPPPRERVPAAPGRVARPVAAPVAHPAGVLRVRWCLRPASVLWGAGLVGSVAAAAVLVAVLPVFVVDTVAGTMDIWTLLLGWPVLFAVAGLAMIVFAVRPGNAALRRLRVVVDAAGVRVYGSARWGSRPVALRWARLCRVEAVTFDSSDDHDGTLLPQDYLVLVDDDGQALSVRWLWLDATIERCVAHIHVHRPDAPFLDHRPPAPPGPVGWVIRRRRHHAHR